MINRTQIQIWIALIWGWELCILELFLDLPVPGSPLYDLVALVWNHCSRRLSAVELFLVHWLANKEGDKSKFCRQYLNCPVPALLPVLCWILWMLCVLTQPKAETLKFFFSWIPATKTGPSLVAVVPSSGCCSPSFSYSGFLTTHLLTQLLCRYGLRKEIKKEGNCIHQFNQYILSSK